MASGLKVAACLTGAALVLLGLILSLFALGPEGQTWTAKDKDGSYKISHSIVYAACYSGSDEGYKCLEFDDIEDQPKNEVAALAFYFLGYMVAVVTMIMFLVALCAPKCFGFPVAGAAFLNALFLLIANSFQSASYSGDDSQRLAMRKPVFKILYHVPDAADWTESIGWSCIVPWVGIVPAGMAIAPAIMIALIIKN